MNQKIVYIIKLVVLFFTLALIWCIGQDILNFPTWLATTGSLVFGWAVGLFCYILYMRKFDW